MARLDRLAPVREVARIAACIGRELTRTWSGDRRILRAQLTALVSWPGGSNYDATIIREAASSATRPALPCPSRQQLHARIAQAIERLRPEIAVGQPRLPIISSKVAC
jgi:predicted ATPase